MGSPKKETFTWSNTSDKLRFERLDFLIAAISTALSLIFYLLTMSRSIPYIDGGELTTVLWTLGIAHPTGYPLFTLLGGAFVRIPIFSEVDESKDYSVEMYTRDILTSLPQNSVVISYQWDTFVSASLYYQNVDKLRTDIIVIDKELLRRSWYAAQVHSRYTSLFPKDDPVYGAYQDNLRLFENGLPYNSNSIEQSYSNFIREIIFDALRNDRKVLVGPEIEDQYLYGLTKVPYGLLFEVKIDTNYVQYNPVGLNGFQAAEKIQSDYSRQIINFYSRMFLARAAYEYSHKHLNRTLSWLDRALRVDPALQGAQTAKLQILQELKSK